MIAVNSYPELFTTLLGWQQYQSLWSIIVKTGLAFIPFISLIIKNTAEPMMSQEAKSGYVISLKRIEFGLASMILVIMIACQPLITVQPDVISFKPVCTPSINATASNSGTTFDGAFPNLAPVKIPLWWYATIAISGGITAASTVGLGCVPNLREDELKLNLSKIKSAPLRMNIKQFENMCYIPAWRKYNEEKPDITQIKKQYGSDDAEWMGSHAFLNLPGYYDSLRAPEPVQGFPYQESKDWPDKANHPKWGAPSCKDWWQQSNIGIYDQIKNEIKPDLWQRLVSEIKGSNVEDSAIKKLIEHSMTGGYNDMTSGLSHEGVNLGSRILAVAGLAYQSISFFPHMYLLIESLPLIQAYLLMACYIFLAVAIPASRYKASTVISITFVVFSIVFWSYLWELAKYVDTAMIKALNPMNGVSHDLGGTQDLTDIVGLLMYIVLPLFWTAFMGWAGIQVGNGANNMVDRVGGITSASGAGASSIGTKAIGGLSSKIP